MLSDRTVGSKENIRCGSSGFTLTFSVHAHTHIYKPRLCRRMQIARRCTCYGSSGTSFQVSTSCQPANVYLDPPPAARRRRHCATEARKTVAALQQRRQK